MSELTKLIKSFASHKATIEDVQSKITACEESGDWTQGRKILEVLQTVCNAFTNEIVPNSDKFYSKLGGTDPVTGLKRFGANTEAKISELKANVQTFHSLCQEMLLDVTEKIELHCPITVATEVKSVDLPTVFTINAVKSAEEMKLESQRLAQEKEDAEISRKALLVRERKANEAAEQIHFDEEISAKLMSIEKYVNGWHLGGAIHGSLKKIVEHYQQIGNPKIGVELLKMAASILERVINKPDDSACRKLRITHPVLMTKLTGLYGGIELMITIGFRLKTSCVSVESSAMSRPEDQKANSSHSAVIRTLLAHDGSTTEGPLTNILDIFSLLSPHTHWDATLEMTEPALDLGASSIGGKNDWIEWFDGLTRSREAITHTMKLLQ